MMRVNLTALANTISTRVRALPIVILYVTAGCNLRCMTCSYRDPLPNELTLDEYRELSVSLRAFGLRHVVFSGGEPLLRRDFPQICDLFSDSNVRQSLLTNGLLLEKRLHEIKHFFHEIIVSLDGPEALIHDAIRGVSSFDVILRGIKSLLSGTPRPKVSIRMVIQKRNFRSVPQMVEFCKKTGVDRISFLAADVLSQSFHRDHVGPVSGDESILLDSDEAREFTSLASSLGVDFKHEFDSKFISESPAKMLHMAQYFQAFHGLAPFPRNRCNAPMVSTVITSTGELLPCYFLPSFGNLRLASLESQMNKNQIRSTRREVRRYSLEQCRKCVCTLNISPLKAAMDVF